MDCIFLYVFICICIYIYRYILYVYIFICVYIYEKFRNFHLPIYSNTPGERKFIKWRLRILSKIPSISFSILGASFQWFLFERWHADKDVKTILYELSGPKNETEKTFKCYWITISAKTLQRFPSSFEFKKSKNKSTASTTFANTF